MDAFSLAAKLSLDSSAFESSLKKSEGLLKSFGNTISSAFNKVKKMSVALGAATGVFLVSANKEAMSFDQSMAKVAATMGKSVSEIQQLSKFAREMGATTAFSATEAAEALNYMALAGYDTNTAMKMLPKVLDLAAAGEIELARASDMVTDAQSALGLSIEETGTLVDQMAKASSKTNTSVEQLGDAMLTVGGTAKAMSGGLIDKTTELSMTLGVLADNGIKGAEGGTALRNVMLSLSAPTDKAAKQLKKLGVDVFDAEGNMRDMPDIMQDLNDAMAGMTAEERTSYLNDIFNKRDLKAVEALLGTSKTRWKELYDAISDCDGAAKDMAETRLDNLAGDITKFKSALGEAKLVVMERITPSLRRFTQIGTVMIQRLSKAFGEKGFLGILKETKAIMKDLKTATAKWLKIENPGEATWGDIALGLLKSLKEKINIKKILMGDDYTDGVTWGDVASHIATKIKNGAGKFKIGLAHFLDVEKDDAEISWSDIALKLKEKLLGAIQTTKIFLAELLDLNPEESTWTDIGVKIFGYIKNGIKKAASGAHMLISDVLGLTATGASQDVLSAGKYAKNILQNGIIGAGADMDTVAATWKEIGSKLWGYIKSGFKKGKETIATWLGVENPNESTWREIGGKLFEHIKNGFQKTRESLAKWLGFENPDDQTWGNIGSSIWTKLRTGFKNAASKAKLGLSDLLGLTEENAESKRLARLEKRLTGADVEVTKEAASWIEIGKKIGEYIKKGIKSVKLGIANLLGMTDENGNPVDDVTWTQIAEKVVDKFSDAFKEGGLMDTLLTTLTDKAGAIAEFAAKLIEGIANWISDNTDIFVEIITKIVNALAKAATPIVEALIGIITDPRFQNAIYDLVRAIINALKTGAKELWQTNEGKVILAGAGAYTGVKMAGWAMKISKLFQGGAEAGAGGGKGFFSSLFSKASPYVQNGILGPLATYFGAIAAVVAGNNSRTDFIQSQDEARLSYAKNYQKELTGEESAKLINTMEHMLSVMGYQYDEDGNVKKSVFGTNVFGSHGDVEAMLGRKPGEGFLTEEWMRILDAILPESTKGKYHAYYAYLADSAKHGTTYADEKRAAGRYGSYNDWANSSPETLGALADEIYRAIGTAIEDRAKRNKEYREAHPEKATVIPNLTEDGAKKYQSQLDAYTFTANIQGKVSGGVLSKVFGSHAKGGTIPYDDYVARLHRGEMVLTASQARRYRDGEGSFDGATMSQMVAMAVDKAMSKVYVMLSGEKVGDLTTKRVKNNINAINYSRLRALGG